MLHYRPLQLSTRVRFAATMLYGATALLPFHIMEQVGGNALILDALTIAAIAVVPGLGAYLRDARIQRAFGDSLTALILCLLPVYKAAMA